ncbi:TatD family hydrolase [Sphingobacterium sp. Mn56C]|uniref:TatD family hydrolase n=1 Tax=Sphingobacterium sp. Mn56C TaxID=3395261 RepID=UPI003BD8E339
MEIPYLDIHTHTVPKQPAIFALRNKIIGRESIDEAVCSAGIHPWYLDTDLEAQLLTLEEALTLPQVIAVGECGLDKLCATPWDKQLYIFEQQIQLANRVQKPLIIHCVKAYQEVMMLLEQHRVSVPVIFHGFHKKLPLAQTLLKKGYVLSLGPSILKAGQDSLIKTLPLTNFFLETDDKPVSIAAIYAYFCSVRNISMETLKTQLAQNLSRLFDYSI